MTAFTLGPAIGLAQWLVLKRYTAVSFLWVVITSISVFCAHVIVDILYYPLIYMFGSFIGSDGLDIDDLIGIVIIAAIASTIVSLGQFLVLRLHSVRPVRWLVVSICAWSLGIVLAGAVLFGLRQDYFMPTHIEIAIYVLFTAALCLPGAGLPGYYLGKTLKA